MQKSARVKPIPVAIPSKKDSIGPFFDANASARARIMQFTTMSGMNSPRDASIEGKYAFIISSTAVTKPEIITIYDAILTSFGIILRRSEINRFENARTTMTDTPIPRALTMDVVVASVGHIPRSCTNVGLLVIMPSRNS